MSVYVRTRDLEQVRKTVLAVSVGEAQLMPKRTIKKILDELAYAKDRLRDFKGAGETEENIKCVEQDIAELEEELAELG